MGLLRVGKPMNWHDALPYVQFVREHGVKQFLNIYDKLKDRKDDVLKWGDEIEYFIAKRDDDAKCVYLSLRAKEILEKLVREEETYWKGVKEDPKLTPPIASWKPEYGRFMIEGTPFFPYEGCISCYLKCEENMEKRRLIGQSQLHDDESLVSMTMFPLMGAVEDLVYPPLENPSHEIAQSLFLPDEIINEHPRFPTLTKNIRERRGGKVCILVPLYLDTKTDPEIGQRVPWDRHVTNNALNDIDYRMSQCSPTQCYLFTKVRDINPLNNPEKLLSMSPCQQVLPLSTPSIYMDAMGFGMGCCCLQATFQARDINEARNLYDQLAVLCPILLALTAATPIVRGLLAETDVRWNIVSASVDDRTPSEKTIISKSRYDSISTYIGTTAEAERYSDLKLEIDHNTYKTLIEHGIDHVLAKHISHLFIRDPLVIFTDFEEVNDETDTDHFENIQSTNWQTMRFKPPPANSSIGWRVEFRVMEVQITDFENAAFTVFIVLLTRVILSFGLNFYMPLSRVDNNMAKAHKRDAVRTEKFAFRRNIHEQGTDCDCNEFTIDEIINGKEDGFVGLVPLMRRYLDQMMDLEVDDRIKLEKYITLVSKRASGELMTTATYLRKFVMEHEAYGHDSIITEEIAYDLIKMADCVSMKQEMPVELLGDLMKKK